MPPDLNPADEPSRSEAPTIIELEKRKKIGFCQTLGKTNQFRTINAEFKKSKERGPIAPVKLSHYS